MSRRPALSRRRFFQAVGSISAAALVCPAIVSARALGAEEARPASERITVGMIGVGRQAFMTNMKQFLVMPDVQLVAVCDVDSWRRDNAKRAIEEAYAGQNQAGKYRGCDTYVDYEELLHMG